MDAKSVLLVDRNFVAVSLIGWRKATKLLATKKAEIIADFSDSYIEIGCAKGNFILPSVLRLKHPVPWKVQLTLKRFSKKGTHIRDGNICQYCGKKVGKNATIDHVIPRHMGGGTDYLNCVTSCKTCNNKKGGQTLTESGMKLLNRPRKPNFYTFYRSKLAQIPTEWKCFIFGEHAEE